MLNVGEKAPSFSTVDQEGEKVSLKDFLGKKVVLFFYPKDDTPGCTKEACAFRDHFDKFQSHNIEILGIGVGDQKTHKKFIDKYGLPFTLLVDDDHTIASKYLAWKEKNMYGRTYMGIPRITYVIDEEGKIIKTYPKVKPESHADEILSFITD